jgi:hypothetical protein
LACCTLPSVGTGGDNFVGLALAALRVFVALAILALRRRGIRVPDKGTSDGAGSVLIYAIA